MNSSMMNDYLRGMDHLDMVSPVFAKFVLSMGIPNANYDIPTACVRWDVQSKRISFEMNPTFTETLSDEGMAAAMAHETYHVLLKHLEESRDLKRYPRHQVLTIAHECIINDGLKGNVGVELPEGFWSGPEKFQQDFSYFSTQQGYDFILKKLEEEEEDSEENDNQDGSSSDASGQGNTSSKGASSGNPSNSDAGSTKPSDDSEDENGGNGQDNANEASDGDEGEPKGCGGFDIQEMSDDDLNDFKAAVQQAIQDVVDEVGEEALPDFLADISVSATGKGFSRGGTHSTMFYSAPKTAGMELNWVQILSIINPDILSKGNSKPQDTWQRVPRRLTSIYPHVILPDRKRQVDDPKKKGRELPVFVVALDLSGSIPRHLVNTLMKLVESVPTDIISPKAITWSDGVQEYDERKKVVRAGGTDIDAVYRYAKNIARETGRDPYVLVITDGQCSFYSNVDKTYLQKQWFWCAIQDNDLYSIRTNFVQRGNANEKYVYKLSDLSG